MSKSNLLPPDLSSNTPATPRTPIHSAASSTEAANWEVTLSGAQLPYQGRRERKRQKHNPRKMTMT